MAVLVQGFTRPYYFLVQQLSFNRPLVTTYDRMSMFISALKPDIGVAEKVSDSLACGEALEDAMLQRDMAKIEEVKNTIEKKGEDD